MKIGGKNTRQIDAKNKKKLALPMQRFRKFALPIQKF